MDRNELEESSYRAGFQAGVKAAGLIKHGQLLMTAVLVQALRQIGHEHEIRDCREPQYRRPHDFTVLADALERNNNLPT